MSLSGGQKSGGGTQVTEPWAEQKPYLIKQFDQAGELYKEGNRPQYYEGNTVAPLSDMTMNAGNNMRWLAADNGNLNTASDAATNTATGQYLGQNIGDPAYQGYATGKNAVSNLTMDTASGQYLNSNPYLDAMYGKAAQGVKQQYGDAMLDTQSAFNRAGRYGSGNLDRGEERNSETLAKGLGDLATDIYGGNYANERGLMETAQGRAGDLQLKGAAGLSDNYKDERGNMITAAGMAPQLEAAKYIGADKEMEFGKYLDSHAQDGVNADISKWDFEQNSAQQALNNYIAAIQGNYGGTQTSKTKQTSFGFELPLFS